MHKGMFRTGQAQRQREDMGGSNRGEPGGMVTFGCTQGLDMLLCVKHRLENEGQEGSLGEILSVR